MVISFSRFEWSFLSASFDINQLADGICAVCTRVSETPRRVKAYSFVLYKMSAEL